MKTAWIGILVGALMASCVFNVLQYRKSVAKGAMIGDMIESLELSDVQMEELSTCCDGCGCLDDGCARTLRAGQIAGYEYHITLSSVGASLCCVVVHHL